MAHDLDNSDSDLLQRLEEGLWREETRFDIAYMKQLLADDFIEFGRSGRVYDRADILEFPRQAINAIIPLQGFAARLLSQDVAQVTYNSGVMYDEGLEKGRRSSIWRRSGESWELVFHQGTPF